MRRLLLLLALLLVAAADEVNDGGFLLGTGYTSPYIGISTLVDLSAPSTFNGTVTISCADPAAIYPSTLRVSGGSAKINITFMTYPQGKAVLLTVSLANGTVVAAANVFPRVNLVTAVMPTTATVGDTVSLKVGLAGPGGAPITNPNEWVSFALLPESGYTSSNDGDLSGDNVLFNASTPTQTYTVTFTVPGVYAVKRDGYGNALAVITVSVPSASLPNPPYYFGSRKFVICALYQPCEVDIRAYNFSDVSIAGAAKPINTYTGNVVVTSTDPLAVVPATGPWPTQPAIGRFYITFKTLPAVGTFYTATVRAESDPNRIYTTITILPDAYDGVWYTPTDVGVGEYFDVGFGLLKDPANRITDPNSYPVTHSSTSFYANPPASAAFQQSSIFFDNWNASGVATATVRFNAPGSYTLQTTYPDSISPCIHVHARAANGGFLPDPDTFVLGDPYAPEPIGVPRYAVYIYAGTSNCTDYVDTFHVTTTAPGVTFADVSGSNPSVVPKFDLYTGITPINMTVTSVNDPALTTTFPVHTTPILHITSPVTSIAVAAGEMFDVTVTAMWPNGTTLTQANDPIFLSFWDQLAGESRDEGDAVFASLGGEITPMKVATYSDLFQYVYCKPLVNGQATFRLNICDVGVYQLRAAMCGQMFALSFFPSKSSPVIVVGSPALGSLFNPTAYVPSTPSVACVLAQPPTTSPSPTATSSNTATATSGTHKSSSKLKWIIPVAVVGGLLLIVAVSALVYVLLIRKPSAEYIVRG